MSSKSEKTSIKPLTYRANSTEAAYLQGIADAMGITKDEAFTMFVRFSLSGVATPSKREGKRKEVAQSR